MFLGDFSPTLARKGEQCAAMGKGRVAEAMAAGEALEPLFFEACEQHDPALVRHMVDEKLVDVDVADEQGMRAMHWACYHSDCEMVQWLESRGAKQVKDLRRTKGIMSVLVDFCNEEGAESPKGKGITSEGLHIAKHQSHESQAGSPLSGSWPIPG